MKLSDFVVRQSILTDLKAATKDAAIRGMVEAIGDSGLNSLGGDRVRDARERDLASVFVEVRERAGHERSRPHGGPGGQPCTRIHGF